MKVHIKNMVCNRCIMAVDSTFREAGIVPEKVSLGEVITREEIPPDKLQHIENKLNDYGFEIIDDIKSRIIQKIKNLIIDQIHYSKDDIKVNYSSYIESELNRDYTYLSNLFTSVEGTTIEHYIIHQKIERVKELLVYDELSLSEIAFKLGYSSVAYLSSQFKKVTGLTPSHFKQVGENRRKALDEVQ